MSRRHGHSSPAWAIFTKVSHQPFFDALSDRIIRRFPRIDIIVADQEYHFFSGPTLPLSLSALGSSEVSFIDISCLCYDNILLNAESKRKSYIVVTPDYQILEKKLRAAEQGHFAFPGGVKAIEKKCVFCIPERKMHGDVEPKICDNLIDLAIEISRRQLFLSYAGEDREFADRVATSLSERSLRVWYAPWEIAVGDSIVDRINEGMGGSAYLGVVLSPYSVNKPWCKAELNAALQIKLKDQDVQILPILCQDCDIPPLFKDMFYADFRKSFDRGMKELLRAIR
jgi:hypothetical protein